MVQGGPSTLNELGESSLKLDQKLSNFIDEEDRAHIWQSANSILENLDHGVRTAMGLGYVQSGKTTSMSALCAVAADKGFNLVVAILGSTLLLRDQNSRRIQDSIGLGERNYRWGIVEDLNARRSPGEIQSQLERGRIVFIPVIKNASVLRKLATVLEALDLASTRTLFIDDEADQASLNTRPNAAVASQTNAAISLLRAKAGRHLYVQYTATPYAPLLLNEDDELMPERVEFLRPGRGYTGGREFFIENRDRVIRVIPESDEQTTGTNLGSLPPSLQQALSSYVAGAAVLFTQDEALAPISMLIHSTFKNDIQDRYKFLVDRYLRAMREEVNLAESPLGRIVQLERDRLELLGVAAMDDDKFWQSVSYVLRECSIWLVNSESEIKKINWNLAPFHVLIGGNKLDRGFTVEGLTVSYMNRPASDQIDTVEQRARAFGYRTQLLPFCQFFATARTLKLLREIVHTEDDLRVNLRAYLESGRTVREWAKQIGLLLPSGSRPSRKSVTPALAQFNTEGEWHALRRPRLDVASKIHNLTLIQNSGLFVAEKFSFGRLAFRTIEMTISELHDFLNQWEVDPASSGWDHSSILSFLRRHENPKELCHVVLLTGETDNDLRPRVRKWEDDIGFINLFQGRDTNPDAIPFYKGDRELGFDEFGEKAVTLQIHHVTRRSHDDEDLYTVAIHLGDKVMFRKIDTGGVS